MEELFKEITLKVEQTVTGLFQDFQLPHLKYHNLEHTRNVVRHAHEIARHYSLSRQDHFILTAAAWFHDTGQMFTTPDLHEAESVQIANRFFSKYTGLSRHVVFNIDCAILSTRIPQHPHALIDEILCDADLYHLGTEEFESIDKKVRQEAIERGMAVDNWDLLTLKLLTGHEYHTVFCRKHLAAGKLRNIELLKRRLLL